MAPKGSNKLHTNNNAELLAIAKALFEVWELQDEYKAVEILTDSSVSLSWIEKAYDFEDPYEEGSHFP